MQGKSRTIARQITGKNPLKLLNNKGIILNLALKSDVIEEDEVFTVKEVKSSKKDDLKELKNAIKNELTIELKAELLDEIKKELVKTKQSKKEVKKK